MLYEVASSRTNPDEVPLIRYTVERFSYQTPVQFLLISIKNLKIPVHYSILQMIGKDGENKFEGNF